MKHKQRGEGQQPQPSYNKGLLPSTTQSNEAIINRVRWDNYTAVKILSLRVSKICRQRIIILKCMLERSRSF